MLYKLHIPSSAVGANKVHFDLFNATGSASQIEVISVRAMCDGAVVTGAAGGILYLTRTSAVGTGGTAATREGTDPTAATFSCLWGEKILDEKITARAGPAGGATAGAVLSSLAFQMDEVASPAGYTLPDLVTPGYSVYVKQNSGIRVVQGSVVSLGAVVFNILFKLHPVG